MALPKKPLTPEEIELRKLAAEKLNSENKDNVLNNPVISVPTGNGNDRSQPVIPSIGHREGSNGLNNGLPATPPVNLSNPVQSPQAQKNEFTPKTRGIFEINEGVKDSIVPDPISDENAQKNNKRLRITKGTLTSDDVLTKDYRTHFARLTPKVIEVTDWTQNKLTELDKNTEVSIARKNRGEDYEEMSAFIDNLLVKYFAQSGVVSPKDQSYVIQAVINEVLGLGPLEPLWQDKRISEIMVNGPRSVKVEIKGQIINAPGCEFRDADHLLQVCQQILGDIGRRVDVQKPLADGRLPDQSRINVVHQVVAPDGPYLTIRRFPETAFTVKDLVEKNSMTEEMALFVGNLIHKGCSIIISGGTGSGKTSMLNALSGAIPMGERVLTVEDNLELRLNPRKHVLALEAKEAGSNGLGAVTVRDLVKNALRMRPDRLIIGEVRDEVAYDMLQAMNTGHDGSMTTVHANDPEGAVERIVSLIGQIGDFPPERALPLIGGGLDFIVSVDRYEDGSRRVAAIAEVPSQIVSDGKMVYLKPIIIYEFVQDGIEDEQIYGHYEKRNDISDLVIKKHRLDKKKDLSFEELLTLSSLV